MNETTIPDVRPVVVKVAAMLLAVSAAIKLIDLNIRPHSTPALDIGFVALLLLLALAWLRGKGWARWVVLVSLASGLLAAPEYFERNPGSHVVYFSIQASLLVGAMVLVFLRPSNAFFRKYRRKTIEPL